MTARAALSELLTTARKWQAAAFPMKASTIDGLVRGYVDDLTRDFLDVLDGRRSIPQAENGHRNMLPDLGELAYEAGMEDGGADPAERDDVDEAAIADWVASQEPQVGGLWADIKQLRTDKKNLDEDEFAARQLTINDRIGQWGESLRNLYSLAKANAQKNVSVTWEFGDTDHCDTCQSLNGQRHRLKWFLDKGYIPQENGSQTLDCHGFHCQCELVDDEGNTVMP